MGAVGTAIDFLLLNMLSRLGTPNILANTVSTGVALLFGYFANRRYTFKTEGGSRRREIVLFFVFSLIGLWGVQNLVILSATPLLPDSWSPTFRLNVAKAFAAVASYTWNFLTVKRFVFTEGPAVGRESESPIDDGGRR